MEDKIPMTYGCRTLLVVAAIAVGTIPALAQDVDWRLHNLDLAGSRFAETDQITPENVHLLQPRWLFQHGVIDGVSNQTTPVIVDGIMYVTDSRGSVYAVNAADGHLLWLYDVTELLGGGRQQGYIFRHRGVTYDDGVVYSAAGSFMFALDAKTGEPLEGFGEGGQASVILDVLKPQYADVDTAISMGYWFTSAPQIHNGVLYVGSTRSESRIPGGHVLAIDAKTGLHVENWGEAVTLPGFPETGVVDLLPHLLADWGPWLNWDQPYDPDFGIPVELGYITKSGVPRV